MSDFHDDFFPEDDDTDGVLPGDEEYADPTPEDLNLDDLDLEGLDFANMDFEALGIEDEEPDEEEFASDLATLARFIKYRDKLSQMLNIKKVHEFATAYRYVVEACKDDPEAKITPTPFQPTKDVGGIDIEARHLATLNTDLLAKAIALAHDVEITALTNGHALLSLGFVGLTDLILPEDPTKQQ